MIVNSFKKNNSQGFRLRFDRYSVIIFFIIFPILSCIFLLHYFIVGQAVYGDGISYYAYTRSIYIDRDLNFNNEYSHIYSSENNNSLKEKINGQVSTKNFKNKYFVGAPLFWLPGFAFADFTSKSLNLLGFEVPLSGYSDIYQISVGILNVLFVTIGIYLLYRFFNIFFEPLISFMSIVVILFGSSLLFYGGIDVINSHPFSFLLGSLLLVVWYKVVEKTSYKKLFLLGLISGILAMTRTNDGIFFLPILMERTYNLFKKRNSPLEFLKTYVTLFVGFFIGFFPQLFIWQFLNGTFWKTPYNINELHLLEPGFLDTLFYKNSGLIIWTPVLIFCFVGLIIAVKYKKLRKIGFFCLLAVIFQFYVISSWGLGRLNESFSNRLIVSSLPFFAFGIGSVFYYVKKKFSLTTVYIFTILIILVNILFIFYFLLVKKSPSGTTYESRGKIERLIKFKIN